jgi:hypothetical protein
MHYKNGREAKNGDMVVYIENGVVKSGVLYGATAGNDFCNGHLAQVSGYDPMPNLKNCLHVDDITASEIVDATKTVNAPIQS